MAPRLIGRIRERAVLEEALGSPDPELVAVYGRRRVGKTFLVRETLGSALLFELTGVHGAPRAEQLRNFATAMEAATGRKDKESIADWLQAFQQLQTALAPRLKRGPKRVIFFDELPWLASRKSGFLRAFEHFWNSWGSRQTRLVVVICGSAASWMIERILRAKGGLHNRVTRRLRLLPFTLAETRALLESRNVRLEPYQLVELYMTMGGIPHYLKEVRRGRSAAENIERICFDRDGLLHDEFNNLYPSLFERPERHESIVRVLASSPRGLNRTDLLERAELSSGGRTSGVLSELEASGFITRTSAFGRPVKGRHLSAYRRVLALLPEVDRAVPRPESKSLDRSAQLAIMASVERSGLRVCVAQTHRCPQSRAGHRWRGDERIDVAPPAAWSR